MTRTVDTLHHRLLALLDEASAQYRLIDHPPEGGTAEASRLRGHPLRYAAKCLVIRVRTGKRTARYVLAVVPGDRRVDLAAVRLLAGGSDASFAPVATAEALAGSASGTIIPFAFHPELSLVVDPGVLLAPRLYFNAARLDCSVVLSVADYLALSRPVVRAIAAPPTQCG